MRRISLVISNILVLMALPTYGTPLKVSEILRPAILVLDRRPDKDLKYSRCVGILRTEDHEFYPAGIKLKNGACPGVESVNLQVESELRATVDDGKTALQIKHTDPSLLGKNFVDENKSEWNFQYSPNEVFLSEPSISDPKRHLDDRFCVGIAREQNPVAGEKPRKQLLACNDCSTISACMKSRLSLKPVDDKSTPHASNSEKKADGGTRLEESSPDTH